MIKSENAKYYIWMSHAIGPGRDVEKILGYYSNPKNLYEASDFERRSSGTLSLNQTDRLKKFKLTEAENIMKICERNFIDIYTPDMDEYPKKLMSLKELPLTLYVKGKMENINERLCVSIVGTRKPSNESMYIAKRIAASLSLAGAIVVSGGAIGIDCAAHEGAIFSGGKTISVLGTGILSSCSKKCQELREKIVENGSIVSEYNPFLTGEKYTFPIRNRIISGLSEGTVIIQAGEKSGSLITASLASKQGRDVFAVPGSLTLSSFIGANSLIRDGAVPVFCTMDILSQYMEKYSDSLDLKFIKRLSSFFEFSTEGRTHLKIPLDFDADKLFSNKDTEIRIVKKELRDKVSENERYVYDCINGEPISIENISEKSGIKINEVLRALTTLELLSYVEALPSKKYVCRQEGKI